ALSFAGPVLVIVLALVHLHDTVEDRVPACRYQEGTDDEADVPARFGGKGTHEGGHDAPDAQEDADDPHDYRTHGNALGRAVRPLSEAEGERQGACGGGPPGLISIRRSSRKLSRRGRARTCVSHPLTQPPASRALLSIR